MRIASARLSRPRLAALGAALLAACSSGGGHTPSICQPTLSVPAGDPFTPTGADCDATPALTPGQPFTLSGTVTYDLVPARYDPATAHGGLDFSAAAPLPVRGADVQVRQCTNVLTTTVTDGNGHYTATFVPATTGRIYVAVLARTADPPIQVQDNTDGDAVWAVAQPVDTVTSTRDVHATHGWNGCSYGPWRIAAPFAILDDLYTAERRLLDLPRAVPFDAVPLRVSWSPLNTPSSIGTSYYDPDLRQIFILGAEGIDTDEFDREVIVHEWGHYFEDNFSRSDSPGGPHGFGDVLDPRLAFGEGYASAFAAMLLQQTIYADTYWQSGVMDAFGWDVETRPTSATDDPSPGPFSELSVIRAMWDLYDGVPPGVPEAWDGVALGLAPIYDTLVGPERTTPALTTIASFVAGLKAQPGVSAPAVDAVLGHYGIGPITSAFGDGDTRMQAMFAPVTTFPSSQAVTLDSTYFPNEQPQNRYFFFTAPGTQATVSSASTSDVDLYAYHAGQLLSLAESISGYETIVFATTPGETYVVVLTGWGGLSNPVPAPYKYDATVSFAAP